MARFARVVVPGIAHHVTQRGNRRQDVFFEDGDYEHYVALLKKACRETGVRCLAWCLMPNHVHLILTPPTSESLAVAVADMHRRYAREINRKHDWTGYLFQGRFASYAMDDAHLMNAVRYVELNPVAAGLVDRAEAWRWSSAAAHVSGQGDGVTDLEALAGVHQNWRAMLKQGWTASELPEDQASAIESRLRSGRPLGDAAFLAHLEAQTGRILAKAKPGPRGLPANN